MAGAAAATMASGVTLTCSAALASGVTCSAACLASEYPRGFLDAKVADYTLELRLLKPVQAVKLGKPGPGIDLVDLTGDDSTGDKVQKGKVNAATGPNPLNLGPAAQSAGGQGPVTQADSDYSSTKQADQSGPGTKQADRSGPGTKQAAASNTVASSVLFEGEKVDAGAEEANSGGGGVLAVKIAGDGGVIAMKTAGGDDVEDTGKGKEGEAGAGKEGTPSPPSAEDEVDGGAPGEKRKAPFPAGEEVDGVEPGAAGEGKKRKESVSGSEPWGKMEAVAMAATGAPQGKAEPGARVHVEELSEAKQAELLLGLGGALGSRGQPGSRPGIPQGREKEGKGKGMVEGEGGGEGEGRYEVCVVPVVRFVLLNKSSFFHKMLTSEFRESSENKAVITLEAAELKPFMEALHFMYHNTVSASNLGDLNSLLHLLLQADRFDMATLTAFCARAITDMGAAGGGQLTPEAAVRILSLPPHQQQLPEFQSILAEARAAIRRAYAAALEEGGEKGELLVGLPEVAIQVLLGTSTLRVRSEDQVYAEVMRRWFASAAGSNREALDLLARVILPGIRVGALSYPNVEHLVSYILKLVAREVPELSQDAQDQKRAFTEMLAWANTRKGGGAKKVGGPGVDDEHKSIIAHSQVSHCVSLLRRAGLPVPASTLEWYGPGSGQLAPRLGYCPADATLRLRIPYRICKQLRPEAVQGMEEMQDFVHACNRRMRVMAQLEAGAPPARLHEWALAVYLTSSGAPRGSDGKARVRITMKMGGGKLIEHPDSSIVMHREHSVWQFQMLSEYKWADVLNNKEAFFPGGVLDLKFGIWFEENDPQDV